MQKITNPYDHPHKLHAPVCNLEHTCYSGFCYIYILSPLHSCANAHQDWSVLAAVGEPSTALHRGSQFRPVTIQCSAMVWWKSGPRASRQNLLFGRFSLHSWRELCITCDCSGRGSKGLGQGDLFIHLSCELKEGERLSPGTKVPDGLHSGGCSGVSGSRQAGSRGGRRG